MRYLLTLPEQVAKNTADIAELKEKDREELWTDDCVDIFAHVLAHARFQDDEGVEKAKDLIESLGGTWPEPSFFRVTIPTVEGVDTLTITDADDVEIVDGDLVLEGTEITVRELTLLDGYIVKAFNYVMGEEEQPVYIDEPITVTAPITFVLEVEEEDQLLELTDDPTENVNLLRTALAKGNVTLATGNYPINDEITIDGVTLDLNGSTLTFSKHPTTIYDPTTVNVDRDFTLCGNNPKLINGTVAGDYVNGRGEAGYIPIEDGTTPATVGVCVGDCSDYVLDGVTFHNIPGYAVANDYIYWHTIKGMGYGTPGPDMEPAYGSCRFELTHGTKYCCARYAFGNTHLITTAPLRYVFNNGVEITEWPGKYLEVPEGATYVDVYHTGDYVKYAFVEANGNHTGEIKNCEFYCNQRLGITNLPSYCYIHECTSHDNGYPRVEDHTGKKLDDNTSGFMDFEDTTPDNMLIKNCTSTNDHLGIMFHAIYNATVSECDLEIYARVVNGDINVDNCGLFIYDDADLCWKNLNITDTDIRPIIVGDRTNRTGGTLYGPALPVDATWNGPTINANMEFQTGNGNSYEVSNVNGTITNANITINTPRWIKCDKNMDLTFDNCTITSNGNKLVEQTTINPLYVTIKQVTFRNCTADVEDLHDLVNQYVDVVILDDTMDDSWDNTTNQFTDNWGNNENLIDEWRN